MSLISGQTTSDEKLSSSQTAAYFHVITNRRRGECSASCVDIGARQKSLIAVIIEERLILLCNSVRKPARREGAADIAMAASEAVLLQTSSTSLSMKASAFSIASLISDQHHHHPRRRHRRRRCNRRQDGDDDMTDVTVSQSQSGTSPLSRDAGIIYTVSQKNCAKLFLSQLVKISTNFDIFWQKDGKEAKIMRDGLIFHLI